MILLGVRLDCSSDEDNEQEESRNQWQADDDYYYLSVRRHSRREDESDNQCQADDDYPPHHISRRRSGKVFSGDVGITLQDVFEIVNNHHKSSHNKRQNACNCLLKYCDSMDLSMMCDMIAGSRRYIRYAEDSKSQGYWSCLRSIMQGMMLTSVFICFIMVNYITVVHHCIVGLKSEDGRGSSQYNYSLGRYYKGTNSHPPVWKVCQQAFCKVYQISRSRLQILQRELRTVIILVFQQKQ